MAQIRGRGKSKRRFIKAINKDNLEVKLKRLTKEVKTHQL